MREWTDSTLAEDLIANLRDMHSDPAAKTTHSLLPLMNLNLKNFGTQPKFRVKFLAINYPPLCYYLFLPLCAEITEGNESAVQKSAVILQEREAIAFCRLLLFYTRLHHPDHHAQHIRIINVLCLHKGTLHPFLFFSSFDQTTRSMLRSSF